jgi:hypothetical protein
VDDSRECGNETSGSIKRSEVLEGLHNSRVVLGSIELVTFRYYVALGLNLFSPGAVHTSDEVLW